MKMKMNWGTGVVIAMILFMAFILSFVYKSVVMKEYQHELMSEDYYRDELHYQEEIDKINNASELEENVKIIRSENGILIEFPEGLDSDQITGKISLLRPSNKKLDLIVDIALKSSKQLIQEDQLVSGKYLVIIDWKNGEDEYMFKDNLFY